MTTMRGVNFFITHLFKLYWALKFCIIKSVASWVDRRIAAAVTTGELGGCGFSNQLHHVPPFCPFSIIQEWRVVTLLPRWRRSAPPTLGFKNALQKPFLFLFVVSTTFKTQRGAYTSSILIYSAWLAFRNDTSLFLQRCSACFLQNVWRFYVLRGVRTWKSYAKSDLTVQTKSDFQKCDLNRIPNHIRM